MPLSRVLGSILTVAVFGIALLDAIKYEITNSDVALYTLLAFAGVAILLLDQLSELEFPGGAKLKTYVQRAKADADEIARLKTKSNEDYERISTELTAIQDRITKVKETVDRMEVLGDFLETSTDAENDGRASYDKLKSWANDNSHPFQKRAQDVISKIIRDANGPFCIVPALPMFRPGVDEKDITIEFMMNGIFDRTLKSDRMSYIRYVFERKDFDPKKRGEFLLKIILEDTSLQNVICAMNYFNALTQASIPILDFQGYFEWWEKNKESFKYTGPFQ